MIKMTNPAVVELIARSNRLGADPKVTNYAGGNTSAKGAETDPATGQPVEVLWVKGSGGDLGTLTESSLAVLQLDALRALKNVFPGVDREDELVAAFDYTLFCKGGTAPSIDTAMHGLVEAAHMDHLHPDAGIAFATAADGEELTAKAFGGKVAWVPWRRPEFQLGLDIAAIKQGNPVAIGVILGGHGITARGETAAEAEANSLWIIDTAQKYIDDHGRKDPFGTVLPGYEALPEAERRTKAAALAAHLRSIASEDLPQVGSITADDVVLDFLARSEHPRLAALNTSCPDHFLGTKVKPLVLDLPASSVEDSIARLDELHLQYRGEYFSHYERGVTAAGDAPVPGIRGGGPGDHPHPRGRDVLLRRQQADRPGGGRVLHQRHQRHAWR
jgi:rhamnose utilization protein RhaD (predicted bifunctional aldolase and dehydrogenase)